MYFIDGSSIVPASAAGHGTDDQERLRAARDRLGQDGHVAVALRQTLGQRLPVVAAAAAAVDTQLAVEREVLGVALDRHHVDGLRLVRVYVDRKAEVARQVAADLAPGVAGVVA